MRTSTSCVVALLLLVLPSLSNAAESPETRRSGAARPTANCGTPLGFQVLLDRAGFSPGEIDGRFGPNAQRALAAFQSAQQLRGAGRMNCASWRTLNNSGLDVTTRYRVTEADTRGPFVGRIPDDLMAQAALPSLDYTSLTERLAEKFHSAPALLRTLNPHARIAAGAEIVVPAVTPFELADAPTRDAAVGDTTVDVSAADGRLTVTRADGTVLFVAPVSSGSEHDPLPIGRWHITKLTWRPAFNYNPDLFWDAEASHVRATIKAGPNGPVGIAWLGIDVEHYGIHGTAEPSLVGHAQSHGCVRLTNWDVARLARLVKAGTPVVFR